MVAHIPGESNPRALRNGVMGGPVFENAVIMDIVKRNMSFGSPWHMFFLRDNNGVEVDLILARGSQHIPVEIKLTRTPTDHMITGSRTPGNLLKADVASLLTSRSGSLTLADGIRGVH